MNLLGDSQSIKTQWVILDPLLAHYGYAVKP